MLRYIYKYINPLRWQVGVKIDKVVKVKKKKRSILKYIFVIKEIERKMRRNATDAAFIIKCDFTKRAHGLN